jgi:hypothetical protein
MDLGVRLSSSTLHRYRTQLDLADQLHLGTDTASVIEQLRDLYAARETDLDAAGLQVIKQRALALASAPKTSPTLLKDLHRIFTYEDRKQEKQQTLALRHAQRLELSNLREQTRLQISADRRATAQETLAHRKDIDSQKFQLARERHALELRKQQHREKIDAAKAPQHNANANDEAALRAEALLEYGRQLRRQRETAAICEVGAVVLNGPRSHDAITSHDAAPADLKSEPMSQSTGTLTTEPQPN